MNDTKPVSKRIFSLETLRFFALATIILSHFDFLDSTHIGDFFERYLRNPVWGVDYFFVLSGFGLYLSLKDKGLPLHLRKSFAFAVGKIKRLYLPYVLSGLIYLPFYIFFDGANPIYQCGKFILNLTMLQSLSGVSSISMGLNGVCWFASTLFICYILVPLMIFIVNKFGFSRMRIAGLFCLTVAIILVESNFFLCVQRKYPVFDVLYYGSPYVRVFYVFLGMVLAKAFCRLPASKINRFAYEIVYTMIWILYFFFRKDFQNMLSLNSIAMRLVDIFIVTGSFIFAFNGSIANFLATRSSCIKWGGANGDVLVSFALSCSIDGGFPIPTFKR